MKKFVIVLTALLLGLTALSVPAAAYVERGKVNISVDQTELVLKVGDEAAVKVTLDPEQEDQMPGCGMSDCPEKCGKNCLSKDGNCTCDSTEYDTYYTEVKLKNSSDDVAEASYADGVLTIKALKVGETTVNAAARLREHTGTSADIRVIVEKKVNPAPIIAAAAAAVVILTGVIVFLVKGKKK